MQHLIDSYDLETYPNLISDEIQTVREFEMDSRPKNIWSILFEDFNIYTCSTNKLNTDVLLANIGNLKDNWDEEGAQAISKKVLNEATAIIYTMKIVHLDLYSIAPGPSGEIMLDYRVGKKSLEIILYPNKRKFVKFSQDEVPIQGEFNDQIFPELIAWLNS